MLPLELVLDGIRAMSPSQNQARQGYQRGSKNHRSGEAQRHDLENALTSVTAAPTAPPGAGWPGLSVFGRKWDQAPQWSVQATSTASESRGSAFSKKERTPSELAHTPGPRSLTILAGRNQGGTE
jgi:hypothetical protein